MGKLVDGDDGLLDDEFDKSSDDRCKHGRREAPRRVVRGRHRVLSGRPKASCKDIQNAAKPLRRRAPARTGSACRSPEQGGRGVPEQMRRRNGYRMWSSSRY